MVSASSEVGEKNESFQSAIASDGNGFVEAVNGVPSIDGLRR